MHITLQACISGMEKKHSTQYESRLITAKTMPQNQTFRHALVDTIVTQHKKQGKVIDETSEANYES